MPNRPGARNKNKASAKRLSDRCSHHNPPRYCVSESLIGLDGDYGQRHIQRQSKWQADCIREAQRTQIIMGNSFRLDQLLYSSFMQLAVSCNMPCLMYAVDLDRMFSKEIADSPSGAFEKRASQQITLPKIKPLIFFSPHFVRRLSKGVQERTAILSTVNLQPDRHQKSRPLFPPQTHYHQLNTITSLAILQSCRQQHVRSSICFARRLPSLWDLANIIWPGILSNIFILTRLMSPGLPI